MTFLNATRGLHIPNTDFEYLSEGAYGVVFVDRKQNRIRKIYRRRTDAKPEHCQQVFRAEVSAYAIASKANELKELVPVYFGTCSGQTIIDSESKDVTSEFYPDLAFEAEFVDCNFVKNSKADRTDRDQIFDLFRKRGIKHVVDASVCLQDGHIGKVIDFATEEIELSWDDTAIR